MKHGEILDGILESAPNQHSIFSDIEITQKADCQTKFEFPATKETMKAVGSTVDQIVLLRGYAGLRGIKIKHKNDNESEINSSNVYTYNADSIKGLANKRIASIGF